MNWSLQLDPQNQTFNDKQKDLFAELDKVKTSIPHEKYTDHKEKSDPKPPMKTYKGKKSIFKRPEAPIRKCLPPRRRPDYQINPQKWTKYSLNDVSDEDMSERANKNAAFSFLKELEERREEEKVANKGVCFKKSAMVSVEENEVETGSIFKNSKRVMPEYVVGGKIKKEKRNLKKRDGKDGSKGDKELKLSHLMQEDDGDDDEDKEENT